MTEPPHFRAPFQLGPDGTPLTDPQGSDREIQSCILNILQAPEDHRLGVPQHLRRDDNRPELLAAVREREPRATRELLDGVLDNPDEFPLSSP